MVPFLVVPSALQACAMLVDEGWFHRRRGLPKWERLGHPLDTFSAAACYAWIVVERPSDPHALAVYATMALLSCLLITKDEFVHARRCEPGELWLHAVLFVLHPIVFLALGLLWLAGDAGEFLRAQLVVTLGFAAYQIAYWSLPWKRTQRASIR
jgi:hypothetical protein